MQTFFLYAHSLLRWALLLLLIAAIWTYFQGFQSKKAWSVGAAKLGLWVMILTHTNLLVGLYLLGFGSHGIFTTGVPEGVSVMKDKYFRFFWVEHPTAMLLAVILITLGRGVGKKAIPDASKYRRSFWYFLVALVILLVSIPWPWREVIGRPWL